jgi:hypothetical protein
LRPALAADDDKDLDQVGGYLAAGLGQQTIGDAEWAGSAVGLRFSICRPRDG